MNRQNTHDFPIILKEVQQMIQSPENASVEIFYGSNGILAVMNYLNIAILYLKPYEKNRLV